MPLDELRWRIHFDGNDRAFPLSRSERNSFARTIRTHFSQFVLKVDLDRNTELGPLACAAFFRLHDPMYQRRFLSSDRDSFISCSYRRQRPLFRVIGGRRGRHFYSAEFRFRLRVADIDSWEYPPQVRPVTLPITKPLTLLATKGVIDIGPRPWTLQGPLWRPALPFTARLGDVDRSEW